MSEFLLISFRSRLQISHQIRPEKACAQSTEYCTTMSKGCGCFNALLQVQFRLFCSTTPPKDLRGVRKGFCHP